MFARVLRLVLMASCLATLLAICASPALGAYSAQLRRYPYLTDVVNDGSSGYATINWATDRSFTTGAATYGAVDTGGACAPTTSATATRRSITVNGVSEYAWKAQLTLARNTQYCYRVRLGSVDLLATDPSPRFFTQLSPGASNFSFAVFGDWGLTPSADGATTNPHQANVMQQIANSGVRFALMSGDVPYGSTSNTNYGDLVATGANISAVFAPTYWTVPGKSIPLFPALGNHGHNSTFLATWPQDRAASTSGGRYRTEDYSGLNGTNPATYPSAWYAFDAGNARVYILDASWSDSNNGTANSYKNDHDYHWSPTSDEYRWLQSDLASHPSALKFAVFHYPLYSDNKSEASDTELQGVNNLEGLLSSFGVAIAFNGHAHIYQRNIKPHANSLITYITGGGGARPAPIGPCSSVDAYGRGWSFSTNSGSSCGGSPRPTSASQVFHFLKVTVSGRTVTVAPTDETGNTFDVQTSAFPRAAVRRRPPCRSRRRRPARACRPSPRSRPTPQTMLAFSASSSSWMAPTSAPRTPSRPTPSPGTPPPPPTAPTP
jgi:Calcineurin-like phosphoesterase